MRREDSEEMPRGRKSAYKSTAIPRLATSLRRGCLVSTIIASIKKPTQEKFKGQCQVVLASMAV